MIIFLFGEDSFRSHEQLVRMRRSFCEKNKVHQGDIIVLDGEKISLREIKEATQASSLFDAKRMIVIENIFLNSSKELARDLLEFLENYKNNNVLIFRDVNIKTKKGLPQIINAGGKEKALLRDQKVLFEFLRSQEYSAREFVSLSTWQIGQWINNRVSVQKASISKDAIQALLALVGNDLWRLDNEVTKLVNLQKEISKADVDKIVHGELDEGIFALTDAISLRNIPEALRLINKQIQLGVNENYLLTMILRQVKILVQIKSALEHKLGQAEMIKKLNLHPYVIQKGMSQVRNFSLDFLKNMWKRLLDLDYTIKTGRGNFVGEINLLLVEGLV